MSWFSRIFHRRPPDSDLDEEIRFHLEQEVEQRMARGQSALDAQNSARRDFGSIAQVKEITRQMWGWTTLERLAQDVRYAVRSLLHSPVFASTAVLSLALGIGANVASFSIAEALLTRPLPVEAPAEVLAVNHQSAHSPVESVSYPDFRDLRERNRSFAGVVGYSLARFAFAASADAVPQMKMGMQVTQGFFSVLGVQPVLGRGFTEEESSTLGRGAVAVLGHDFWQQQFARDPRVLGSVVRLNGVPFEVIGVAPETFTGMDPIIRPALFIPVTAAPLLSAEGAKGLEDRANKRLNLRARLKPGVTIEQAQAELTAFSKALEREFPQTHRDLTLRARTEMQWRIQQSPPTVAVLGLLMALSVLVLAIACANVASLLLARSRARAREFSIRLAIGAGQARLVQQLLTESLVVAVCGGAAGLALAYVSIRYLAAIRLPTDTPIAISTQLDYRVMAFTMAVSILSALLFGLAPALRSRRPDITAGLRPADGGASGKVRNLGRSVLIAGQVALSLVLLVVSGTLLDAFRRMTILDPGIRIRNVMMFEFDPAMVGYSQSQASSFYRALVEQTRTLPGVRGASLSRAIPFRPNFTDQAVVPEGYEMPRNQSSITVASNTIDDQYFETMQTPILEGRGFTSHDTATSKRVVVVNAEFAQRYANGRAVGKRLRLANGQTLEVVGVARTAKYLSLAETPQPYIYLPLSQAPSTRMTLLVHTESSPLSVKEAVFRVIRGLDANQPVYNVWPLETFFEQGALGPALIVMQMVGSTGLVGLALAIVGLYGLIAYTVARRTREIGIRMAVGAGRGSILRLVLRQGLTLSTAGVAVGLALSVPIFHLLASRLAGLGELSRWTLVAVPCGLILVMLCACYVPARRASRIDPALSLRND